MARPGKTTPHGFSSSYLSSRLCSGFLPAWLPSSSQVLLHRPLASASALLQPPLYCFLQSTYFILKPFFSGLFPLSCMAVLALHDFSTFKLVFLNAVFSETGPWYFLWARNNDTLTIATCSPMYQHKSLSNPARQGTGSCRQSPDLRRGVSEGRSEPGALRTCAQLQISAYHPWGPFSYST